MLTAPPLVAVSTKTYLGAGRTREWVRAVASLYGQGSGHGSGQDAGPAAGGDLEPAGVELAVLPTFPLLESTAHALAGTGVRWGAQDCAPSEAGAQTGEVLASTLAELGCTYVEVGHAERRQHFGETDEVVRAKVERITGSAMVPLLCVGETERMDPAAAAAWCLGQVESALAHVDGADVVVAYEPLWAIGAQHPAPAEHVIGVAAVLRAVLATRTGTSRVVYGGAAGPGTADALGTGVDGLFLGRFAHQVPALHTVLREVSAVHGCAAPAAIKN